jgi:ABC-type branched-subunit amino acid transport system substrate-binding protein
MKSKSKWLAIFLVLGLVVAACGNGEADDTTTTVADAPETTEPDTPDTTEPDDMDEPDDMEPGDIATDIGVDLDAGVIRVGLLSDLTGIFSPLVQVIVAGHEAYWDDVNAQGGIHGLEVELVVTDTVYEVPTHVQRYEELRDNVVAFGHSTGSPHTVAINSQLQADGILAIPLTWYSGWTDPAINSNLMHHGINYCVEAHNLIGYLTETMGDDVNTIAIVTFPGDYGLDGAIGAVQAAEAAGLEVVYDGSGTIIPGDESTETEAANAIVASGADVVYLVTNPTATASIFGQAIAQGYQGIWTGANPSWNPALLGSPIGEALAASSIWSSYTNVWSSDAPGVTEAKALAEAAGVLERPTSAIFEGFVEAIIMHAALEAAYEAGDLTQAGVLAAAKSLEEVDFNGLAPNESYVGTPNEQLQRTSIIFEPDLEGFLSGESAGESVLEGDYTSQITEAYDFTGACFVLES